MIKEGNCWLTNCNLALIQTLQCNDPLLREGILRVSDGLFRIVLEQKG